MTDMQTSLPLLIVRPWHTLLILVSLCGLISCVSQHKHLLVHLSCHSITKTKQGPFSRPPSCYAPSPPPACLPRASRTASPQHARPRASTTGSPRERCRPPCAHCPRPRLLRAAGHAMAAALTLSAGAAARLRPSRQPEPQYAHVRLAGRSCSSPRRSLPWHGRGLAAGAPSSPSWVTCAES